MNKLQKLRSIMKNIKLAYQYLKDPQVSLFNKGLAIFPLLYIVFPFDFDFFPVIGWLDDTLVAVVIWSYILNKIKEQKYTSEKKEKTGDEENNDVDYEFKDDEYDVK
ncbi:DUF1232 domain-containing protein [Halanaerobacter jeridensis]|uniref:Uncharacterized membrane protein YkvA (DUF1232 family) n=1 Tax=Halanaerobacter jeridensis TaxID=706427 RepID=A0A938XNW1_9FIRM|nr:DUF1232 domain-containing protein [Halanaerobacter jeridensis]MBM7555942.1 uncharacterized membrane protein YkvA (DUF1232 family) [Halanaerobacter jeridensis]